MRSADVVVTATGSAEPLFDGAWLRPGTHVNAVGSNQASNREVDRTTLTRAARVMVDDRAVAALEGGDLLANDYDVTRTVEFSDVVAGRLPARHDDAEITLFDSHGLALHDLVCGVLLVQATAENGLGRHLDFPRDPLPMLGSERPAARDGG